MGFCSSCGKELSYIKEYNAWYCHTCKEYRQPPPPTQARTAGAAPAAQAPGSGLWFQNHYRIRKKVLTVWNKYWIEDSAGNVVGFSKQKMFRLKEDIRIFTDEKMTQELFRIQQRKIMDIWGTFDIIDSQTNVPLGSIRRRALASTFVRDEWEVYDANNQLMGGIYEEKGTGLARKYLPGGGLIPESMALVLHGVPVAEINQQFKIIGDIWDLRCINVPAHLDRRVMLGGLLLMGMIERARK